MNSDTTNWRELAAETVVSRLISLGLYLNSPECAIICTRCQYALQPAGEAVSKHLWEKHEVPLNQRVGLNSFVRSLLSARSKYPSLPTRRICTAPALAHTAWVPLHALQIYNNEPKFVAAPHGNKPPDWRQ
jgi:hypothetical protein